MSNLPFLSREILFIMMTILCTLTLLQIHIKILHVQMLTPVSNLCLSCNTNMRNLDIGKNTVCNHWIFSQKRLLIEIFANEIEFLIPYSSFLEMKPGSSISWESRWRTFKSHHVHSLESSCTATHCAMHSVMTFFMLVFMVLNCARVDCTFFLFVEFPAFQKCAH